MIVFYNKESSKTNKQYKEKSNIVIHKYIDNLALTQESIDLNDLHEESEEARENVDGDVYNNFADKIEVYDDDLEEENEHTSRRLKKMITTPRTKTKKETKIIT
jgi:hypothetical protein